MGQIKEKARLNLAFGVNEIFKFKKIDAKVKRL